METSDALYRRLQEHLDRMPVGFPATESGVEIRILKRLFTPEEAEVALELSAIPESVATVHKRLEDRMTLEELEQKLERMGEKGIILAFGPKGRKRYGKMIYAIGIYERQGLTLTTDLERDTRQYFEEAFRDAFHTGKTTQMRIVPVNKQIAVERSVTTYDEIRAHVESSPGPFGVIRCICRHGQDLEGQPCKQTKVRENCLMIGGAARWATESGHGREVTREEMMQMLDLADQEGLVLQPENTKSPMFVCCCCGCCCGVLRSVKTFERPADFFTSNYYVDVDTAVCDTCGVCETRCQMDAISIASGKAAVDYARCIGCALCVSTCPSGAAHLEHREQTKVPPDSTQALYLQMLQDRYGPLGMAKIGAQKLLGMKV